MTCACPNCFFCLFYCIISITVVHSLLITFPTRADSFHFVHSCAYLHVQLENQRSYKDVLPSERLIYYRRYLFSAICEIRSESYGSKHASKPLPMRHFMRTYIHNSKIIGRIWTFYISNNCSTISDFYFLC